VSYTLGRDFRATRPLKAGDEIVSDHYFGNTRQFALHLYVVLPYVAIF
jgi:hypothetical protein